MKKPAAKTHYAPFCKDCGSQKIETTYLRQKDEGKIDESYILEHAIEELSVYMKALADSYDGCEAEFRFREQPSWREFVAEYIMGLCAMWRVRQEPDAEAPQA
jgi:hypothetical protein